MASKEKSQLGRDYLWNTAASLASALSLVVMLMVVSRRAGIVSAGVYSLAISVGQQMQALGMYEVRTYHVTDVRYRFSFGVYHATRILTVGLMLLGILGYAVWRQAGLEVGVLIMLVASLRCFDAYEDVYYSELQRAGRLDLGGRASFLRIATTTGVFCLMLVATGSLLSSVLVTLAASTAVLWAGFVPPARTLFELRPYWSWQQTKAVLVSCLPLFLASFLAMLLANAPRFAIDRYLDDSAQGFFAVLLMPAVAINLLSLLVFRPLLTRMAQRWDGGEPAAFRALVRRGLLTASAASGVVAVVSWFLGIPLLNLVFSVDADLYHTELMVLVVGGALNSLSVVLYYALTTMRRQNLVLVGYLVAAVVTVLACVLLVPAWGLLGACLAYGLASGTLVLCFTVPVLV